MENNRDKGLTYQRHGNDNSSKIYEDIPKEFTPSTAYLSVDLGNWISNAQVSVQVEELIKIPSQRDKLLRAIEGPKERSLERSNDFFFEITRESNEDVPVILHSIDWTKEDHPPFFVSMLINDLCLHNCMYDYGASSNVITKKVMD